MKITKLIFLTSLLIVGSSCVVSSRTESGAEGEANKDMLTAWGPYQSDGLGRSGLHDERVLQAMSRVPRHKFVPDDVSSHAYEDRALPIGKQQTISQPYVVALMTQEARVVPGSKVLEIGTGSGYQAAVLSELGAEVYTIEIIPELALEAEQKLNAEGYQSVTVRQGDGWQGWEEHAPFDSILVTASTPSAPKALIEQLANHGRLIVPIENKGQGNDKLLSIERRDNNLITRNLGTLRFVPLTGAARAEAKAEAEDQALDVANQLIQIDPAKQSMRGMFSSIAPSPENKTPQTSPLNSNDVDSKDSFGASNGRKSN